MPIIRLVTAAILASLAAPAFAQSIVDGSGAGIAAPVLRQVLDLATGDLKDPLSAQVRKLRLMPNMKTPFYCGEVNAKNTYGGYVGFRPFFVDLNGKRANVLAPPEVSREMYDLKRMQFEVVGCVPKKA